MLYAMPQLVTRVDEELVKLLDELVSQGVVESRSAAVRQGLRMLVEEYQRRRTAQRIIQGYERQPQTEAEVGWADQATIRMIEEEPW